MADDYYAALIEAWDNPVQPPPGVTGAPLTASMATDEKILVVNAWTIVGAIPARFFTTGAEMLNCIDWGEFAVLQPEEQINILTMCGVPGPLVGGLEAATLITGGMFMSYFALSGPTIAALTKLAEATVQPWWQASVDENGGGLSSPVNEYDVQAAGLS